MSFATDVVIGRTNGTASSFSGFFSPVGNGITPSTIDLSIDDGLGGFNPLGIGTADNGSGALTMADGQTLTNHLVATGNGTKTSFAVSLGIGFVTPNTITVYENGVSVATDNGAGVLTPTGGGTPESITFPGGGPGHTYSKMMTPAPVVAGSGILKVSGGATIATDNGSGQWVGSGVSGSSINYSTGATVFTLASDETSVNLEITWDLAGGASGTLNYTPGNATIVFATAPGNTIPITVTLQAYGFLGTINYGDGAFTLQTGFSSPIVGSSGFNLYASYTYAAFAPVPSGGINAVVLPGASAQLIQMLGNGYGIDVLCLDDLDKNFSLVQNALPQDVWHLITEEPGNIFWSTIQTFSIRSLLSKGITPSSTASVQAVIQSVISADERVAQCQCFATFDGAETLSLSITVFPEQGSSFNLVCSINKVTITLVSIGNVNL